MKKYLCYSLIFIFFLCMEKSYSQNDEPPKCYSKGTIATLDAKTYFVEDIQLYSDFVTFLNEGGVPDRMQPSNILKINAKTGSYADVGAYVGGSIFLAYFIFAGIYNGYDYIQREGIFFFESTIIGIAVGAGLGALVGLIFPRYEDVFVNDKIPSLPINMNSQINNFGFCKQNIISVNIRL